MKRSRDNSNGKKEYLLTGSIIVLVFLLLCVVKQIFPFGNNTIDNVDFEQQWVPVYYHVWDFLHGKGSLFFDWNVGGGNNFVGAASQFSLVSPFNLFFLFIQRSWIEKSMTFFILIKLVAMGCAMCFFLRNAKRVHGLGRKWIVAGSAAYALSAYSFMYYGLGWLDTAVIFPILIYHFLAMTEKEISWKPGKHAIGYTVCLMLVFIINIPQAYMVCFFLILFAGGYFFLLREHDKRNKAGILKFGLVTILALGLSAWMFVPAALAILSSSRLSGVEYTGQTGYFWLLSQSGMDAYLKRMMLYSVIIPVLYLIITMKKKREHRWQLYLVVLMVIPVFVEAVNLLWHKGTYMCFPMRHGYMMIFAILMAAGERLSERLKAPEGTIRRLTGKRRTMVTTGALLVWAGIILVQATDLLVPLTHEKEFNFVSDAEELGMALLEKTDIFHKVKIADASIEDNYPLISKTASYSNYLHLMLEEQLALSRGLGYSQVWTRISDTGGTLFSDALLGYQYVVNSKLSDNRDWMANNEKLYQKVSETEHFLIDESKCGYGLGLTVGTGEYAALNQTLSNNVFENQNAISNLLFGENLFTTWTKNFADVKESEELTYHIKVEGDGILYVYSKEFSGADFTVNGKSVPVPSRENIKGTKYLTTYNNAVLNLGEYQNEEVELVIHQTCYDTGIPKTIYFGILDVEAFEQTTKQERLTSDYVLNENGATLTVTAEQDEYLFLPVNADNGWQCTRNGEYTDIVRLYGDLMLIPLQAGENQITLTYSPKGMKKGSYVTAAAIFVLLLWIGLSRIKRSEKVIGAIYHVCSYVALVVFFAAWAGYLIGVYVIPIGYTIYS